MASKENKFAATGGGAMLNNKPTAQSSFGMQNMGRNNAQMRPPQSMQAANSAAPNGGGENKENSQNPSELGNGNELQNDQNQGSPTDQAQKELVKKAGEAALSAAGVPQPVSKKIIDKAEETGALDKINEEINKFKKKKVSIVASIVSSLLPVVSGAVMWLLIAAAIMSVFAYIQEFVDDFVNFFYDIAEFASGKTEYYDDLKDAMPELQYIDYRVDNAAATQKEEAEKKAIKQISDAWASILAPISYKINELDSEKKFCKSATFLAMSKNDVCALTFAGFAKDDGNGNKVSYYQQMVNSGQASSLIDAANKTGCYVITGGWDKFNEGLQKFETNLGCLNVVDDSVYTVKQFLKETLHVDTDWLNNLVSDGLSWVDYWITGDITSSATLTDKMKLDLANYSFDAEAYKAFLTNYYIEARYKDAIDLRLEEEYVENPSLTAEENATNKAAARKIIVENYINDIILYQAVYSEEFVSDINISEEYLKAHGSASEEDLVATLSPVYGNNSCAALELYNPLTHEFTESQGVSSSDIHSVSDGEVIYVNKNTSNLYDKWDSSKQKCICDGSVCDNYDGNQIKVKFVVNNIEYIATYSNLDTVNVNVGDTVTKGQVIATEGNSGCTNMKKLKFQLTSENGINYNTNELLEKCSSSSNTMNACNFNNIQISLVDCDNKLIKNLPLYDYIKEDLYRNYKFGLDNVDFLKAGAISITSKFLNNNNYKVGVNELTVKVCNYKEVEISSTDSRRLDEAINAIRGQVMTYNNKAALTRYELSCNRTEKDKTTNSVYNTMCINKALELARNGKDYQEILEIYYPNYRLNTNYCLNYASSINKYALNNDKSYISAFDEEEVEEINNDLKERINMVGTGTRAAAVETARYISLGLEGKIPYKNGGKYFEIGINPNWASNGFDSCGFISWVLFNSGADIEKSLTISGIVKSANITGNIKINSDLYKYYDKIQVGDFAYREDRIGIVIGKNDGILYIAEANSEKGLIVTTISSYGESESAYTHIYFADNYYNGTGNITSMW